MQIRYNYRTYDTETMPLDLLDDYISHLTTLNYEFKAGFYAGLEYSRRYATYHRDKYDLRKPMGHRIDPGHWSDHKGPHSPNHYLAKRLCKDFTRRAKRER